MDKGVSSPAVSKDVDHPAELRERYLVHPPVLTQEPSLDELRPADGVATGWLDAEHRPVGPATALSSLEPPMKGRRGEP